MKSKDKLVCLASQFRLVRICEAKQNNGNLEGIDALLGEEISITYLSFYFIFILLR